MPASGASSEEELREAAATGQRKVRLVAQVAGGVKQLPRLLREERSFLAATHPFAFRFFGQNTPLHVRGEHYSPGREQ